MKNIYYYFKYCVVTFIVNCNKQHLLIKSFVSLLNESWRWLSSVLLRVIPIDFKQNVCYRNVDNRHIRLSITKLIACAFQIMHLGFFTIATILDFSELLPQSVFVGKILNKIREMNDFFFMTVMLPISMVNTSVTCES